MSLTAKDMVGVHLLDLISLSNPEIASFGNTSNDAYVQWYHNNDPSNAYHVGYLNQSFNICSNVPSLTNVGVGTTSANPNATMHVHGTLMASNISTYNPNNTLLFNNQSIGGISNITFRGDLYQGDSLFKTSQWESITANNIYFPGNVGVGGVAGPDSNLFVAGNVVITGTITAQSLTEKASMTTKFTSAPLYSTDCNGFREVFTNTPIYSDRVLFSFSLTTGRYLMSTTIPYKNLSSMLTFDTFNWAFIGLYKASPSTYSSTLSPINTLQLNSIGSTNTTDVDDVNISWFVEVEEDSPYVIAINGKGHNLRFGPYFQDEVRLAVVPIKALGTSDRVDVRQKLQVKPIRTTFRINKGVNLINNRFNISTDGYYEIYNSNIEIYYNDTVSWRKLYYMAEEREFYVGQVLFQDNRTSANITLNFPTENGHIVDAIIWLESTADTFFEAGYLYQNYNISSIPWQMIEGGGVRLPENKCVIDGDLYVSGSIYGGCNTSTFISGGIIADYFGDFEESVNIVNTLNISDKAVTIPKLDLFNGNVGIGTSTPPERLMVMGNIAPALSNTYNLGTSNLPWKDVFVSGQLRSTVPHGTAPFTVISSNQVANLNSSLLEGSNSAFYRNVNNMNAGILSVTRGGIGIDTLANNKLLVGAGTNAIISPTNLHWDNATPGNLGIGTVNPRFTVDVNGTMRVQNTANAGVTLQVGNAGGVAMSTLTDSKLRINPSQNFTDVVFFGSVGIGTTTPSKPLSVQGEIRSSSNILADLQFLGTNGASTIPTYSWLSSPSTGFFSPALNTVSIATNGLERVRILANGNVGIGTTNPENTLAIAKSSGCNIISMTNIDATTSTIAFTMGYSNDNNMFFLQKNKSFTETIDSVAGGLANCTIIRDKGGRLVFQSTEFGEFSISTTGHMLYTHRPLLSAYLLRAGGGFWPLPTAAGTCNIVFNNLTNNIIPTTGSYNSLTGEYTTLLAGRYFVSATVSVSCETYTVSTNPIVQTSPTEAYIVLRRNNVSVPGFGGYVRQGNLNLVGAISLQGNVVTHLNVNDKLKVEAYGFGRPRLDTESGLSSFNVVYLG